MNTITATELKHMFDEGEYFTLINTLAAEHFAETHIPHSINVPQDEENFVEEVLEAVENRKQPVVVYCASRRCDSSAKAAEKLEAAGFTNIMRFEGGAEEWQASGQRLEESAV